MELIIRNLNCVVHHLDPCRAGGPLDVSRQTLVEHLRKLKEKIHGGQADVRRTAGLPGELPKDGSPGEERAVTKDEDVHFGMGLEGMRNSEGVGDVCEAAPTASTKEGCEIKLHQEIRAGRRDGACK